jgi:7-cyano-7-deazaguanine tRNA-ribosyltransferase
MESYRFDVLVDMILTAKMNLPNERPLHLFGAGHPAMFSLAVALGCDFFDSAAYALYARENRYMTENGTWKLDELDYFPCQCPRCGSKKPRDVQTLPDREREIFLAEHNLHVCQAELNRIKQAIRDGRLWEHMEMRAHAHPMLLSALKKLKNYEEYIEKYSPIVKKSGLFFFDSVGLARPEVIHYKNQLRENYSPPTTAKTLLLAPQTRSKPFHKAREYQKTRQLLKRLSPKLQKAIHVCFYDAPFGVIPLELDEVYPLSQHEAAVPFDKDTIDYTAKQVADYVNRSKYTYVVLLHNPQDWENTVKNAVKKACLATRKQFEYVNLSVKRQKAILTRLEMILNKNLSE